MCFNDEWDEAEIINGITVRNVGELALGFHLTPLHDSIHVFIDDTSMNSTLVIECSSHPDSVKHQYSAVYLPLTKTNRIPNVVFNGLQEQTWYHCCIKAISNSTLSLVQSVRIKCDSVRTLTSQFQNAVSGEGVITVTTLGSILGVASVVGIILASILIAICFKKSSCHCR